MLKGSDPFYHNGKTHFLEIDDDMALLDALTSPAFYVGAIGLRRNCDARRQRLRELGTTAAQLQRLHAPVGLPIGSHTPPEIAVSILAEITRQRNAVSHPALDTSFLQEASRTKLLAGLRNPLAPILPNASEVLVCRRVPQKYDLTKESTLSLHSPFCVRLHRCSEEFFATTLMESVET
ncbi:MAG: XdhC family protein [Pseudomonadota bacterium]|nr:MAG: XdhC family protein [Pseudomonadota bacterium]